MRDGGGLGTWMGIEWGNISLLGAMLIALIFAIAKGLLYLPVSVEQWQSQIDQWKSRFKDMRDDRDYWRIKAHDLQDKIDKATSQSEGLEDNDV